MPRFVRGGAFLYSVETQRLRRRTWALDAEVVQVDGGLGVEASTLAAPRVLAFTVERSLEGHRLGHAVESQVASLWSNHAERDKHIASKDFLDVAKFADAKFVSTAVKPTGKDTADVTGDLTFHGVTKPVTFKATFNGEGKDPWGGERAGFNAKTTVNLNDFGIKGPGPSSQTVDLDISLEGVKQK